MNAIAIVEHLRSHPDVLALTGAGSMGFVSVPGRANLPHIIVAGGEGGDANYTFGSNRGGNSAFYDDSFTVFACSAGTETQSDAEECVSVLDAVEIALSTLEIPGAKITLLRYKRPAMTEVEQRTTSDDILRMGRVYDLQTTNP